MKLLWSGLATLLVSVVVVKADSCCDIDPSSVSLSTRQAWCSAELNTCSTVCGGSSNINTCDTSTFDYTCTCASGISPNISDYSNSLPSLECNQWISNCISSNANDATAQAACSDVTCGSKDASDAVVAVSSAASSPASSSQRTSTASSSSTSRSSSLSTESSIQSTGSFGAAGSATLVSSSTTRSSSSISSRTSSTVTSSANSTVSGAGADTGNPDGNKSARGGLSTGAKAGIATGAVLGVLLVGVLLLFCLRKKRGKEAGPKGFWYHRSTVTDGTPELETKENRGELWGSKFHHTTDRELAGNQIYQAPDDLPVGHPNARDIPAGVMAGAASDKSQKSSNGGNLATSELPADAIGAEQRSLADRRPPQQPPPTSLFPFAGVGPVPTHLAEYEPSIEDEATAAAPVKATVDTPANAPISSANVEGMPLPPASTADDDELARLKVELEQVRKERDRLQLMHSLNSREEELKRAIEVREMG